MFETNKHNISCYCILMWFFIDPCRKTLVFLALETRARWLEVSCLLGLWFVNLSARGWSSSSSCLQTSVLSWFSCSSCFHSFTRRQQQEESIFTHMQISDAKRSLHTWNDDDWTTFFWVAERRKSNCSAALTSRELSVWRMSAGPPLHTSTNHLQNKNGSFSF